MSCAHPILIKNPNYKPDSIKVYARQQYYEVPCGHCLNCLVDKQNYISDISLQAVKEFKYASFVTVTYDQSNAFDRLYFNEELEKFSLRKQDFQNYIKRIRRYLDYHSINLPSVRRDFKYLGCGEYGEKVERPHYHYIFFGLDFAMARDILLKCWDYGIVEIGALRPGGIRYVSKYISKGANRADCARLYDNNDLERPFVLWSKGLGKNLFTENIEDIKDNNYCYLSSHNIRRPLPTYYRNKLLGHQRIDYRKITQMMLDSGLTPEYREIGGEIIPYFSKSAREEFLCRKAKIKEKALSEKLHQEGASTRVVDSLAYHDEDICYDYVPLLNPKNKDIIYD